MLLSILLPPILSRSLTPYDLSIWMLALQVANYLIVLNLGLQIVVARLVAQAEECGDTLKRNSIISTAFFSVLIVTTFGTASLYYLINTFHWTSPSIQIESLSSLNTTVSWIAASFVIWLPSSLLLATFIGQQRNVWYALAMFVTRIILLLVVSAAAYTYQNVVDIAKSWFFATTVGSICILILHHLKVDNSRISLRLFSKSQLLHMVHNSFTISIWSILSLIVTGGQVFILGLYELESVGIFASALGLATVMIGVSGAINATLVPIIAARLINNRKALPVDDLVRISVVSNVINFGGSATLALGGWWIAKFWLGDIYSEDGSIIIGAVAISQSLRSCLSTYAMAVIGLGLQNKLLVGPIGEGFLAILISCLLVPDLGVYGIITAMLTSPMINIFFTLATNPIRQQDDNFHIYGYFWKCCIIPSLPLIAIVIYIVGMGFGGLRSPLAGFAALSVGAGYAFWAAHSFFWHKNHGSAKTGY